jgi:hypothetical protein
MQQNIPLLRSANPTVHTLTHYTLAPCIKGGQLAGDVDRSCEMHGMYSDSNHSHEHALWQAQVQLREDASLEFSRSLSFVAMRCAPCPFAQSASPSACSTQLRYLHMHQTQPWCVAMHLTIERCGQAGRTLGRLLPAVVVTTPSLGVLCSNAALGEHRQYEELVAALDLHAMHIPVMLPGSN